MDDVTGRPDDYAELFKEYYPMMIAIVAKAGIAREDVQDVAMDILARFIEKDGINYYDPEHLHDVGENPDFPGARLRKAKFKGMLRGFTSKYVLQYRDKQMVRHRRIPWRLEKEISTQGLTAPTTWAEFHEESRDEVEIFDVEVSLTIVRVLKKVAEDLSVNSTVHRDYSRLVGLCIEQGLEEGKIKRQVLADELGVSATTATSMISEFRKALRPALIEAGLVA